MLAITNATVYPITSPPLSGGTVLLQEGKIKAVGEHLQIPSEARLLDAGGGALLPGFIDAHCHVGLWEEGLGWEGDDVNELTEPVTPHLRALDAINPQDRGWQDAVRAGITAVWTGPGSGNVVGGQGVALRTGGKGVAEMVLLEPAGLKIALGENPKRVYGEQKKFPSTRMATAALLRDYLTKAANYLAKRRRGESERDLRLEVLGLVLAGRIPLRAHAHRADDIMTALRIADEFGCNIVIEHGTESHLLADELAQRQVPVVIGPTVTARTKVELANRTLETPALLARAGVQVAFMTDHPVLPVDALPLCAALAVREGMPEEAALQALTLNAARVLGVADRLGSIEVGKEADLVLFSGHPLSFDTRVQATIMRGEIVYQE
ncbi:MAG TPA: amidohydrolase [Firmicutes bacterium]|nr:amidohydrolase [Bacillota bacterium]